MSANGSLKPPHINGNGAVNGSRRTNRKQSNAMMPAFMVSAPGKVIVFGEHAVVYGKVRRVQFSSLDISSLVAPLTHLVCRAPL
jgi:mevalonate kinase